MEHGLRGPSERIRAETCSEISWTCTCTVCSHYISQQYLTPQLSMCEGKDRKKDILWKQTQSPLLHKTLICSFDQMLRRRPYYIDSPSYSVVIISVRTKRQKSSLLNVVFSITPRTAPRNVVKPRSSSNYMSAGRSRAKNTQPQSVKWEREFWLHFRFRQLAHQEPCGFWINSELLYPSVSKHREHLLGWRGKCWQT